MASEEAADGADRLNEFALAPLAHLHDEGWGPQAVEIDRDAGEVKFVFTDALEETDHGGDDE